MSFGKCQDIPIERQLQIGVRYLDIRCHLKEETFVIKHGPIDQKMTFTDVLNRCSSFLMQNPSEVIVMKVKEEYGPQGGSSNFASVFKRYSSNYSNLFYRSNTVKVIPTLGAARGKIILLKDFADPARESYLGIDVCKKQGTIVSTINISPTEKMRIQRLYKVWDKGKKATAFLELLNESFTNTATYSPWYINSTSGYHPILPIPKNIANFMGEVLLTALKQGKKGNTGLIPMDFINTAHCKAIIDTNRF